jgi:eukaryotic-like serine/threonine-protein kinase
MDNLNAGRYRLHREVGRGPGGSVHLAHDRLLDRHVAVKVCHAFLASDRAFVTRFWEQALVLARLEHPHWVGVVDIVECEGRPALVSEFVAGASLRDVLRHCRRRLSTEQAPGVVRDVLSLLEHLHELWHRAREPQGGERPLHLRRDRQGV